MDNDKKHSKIKTYTPLPDGTIEINTESYYEELASIKQEIQKHITTNQNTFLGDLISSVDVITGQKTKELTITITADDRYQPKMITKVYTVRKEKFNKK